MAPLLQWGRRVFATETIEVTREQREQVRASMGPSRVRDGDTCWRSTRARAPRPASMGPSRVRDGDRGPGACCCGPSGASMGPSRVRDGDETVPGRANSICSRFNGAVACSRRRPSGARSAPTASRSFNGAVACSRRRPVTPANATATPPSFNGAVACSRRRRPSSWISSSRVEALQWGRRVFATETRRALEWVRASEFSFNGAVACSRRRHQLTRSPAPT